MCNFCGSTEHKIKVCLVRNNPVLVDGKINQIRCIRCNKHGHIMCEKINQNTVLTESKSNCTFSKISKKHRFVILKHKTLLGKSFHSAKSSLKLSISKACKTA